MKKRRAERAEMQILWVVGGIALCLAHGYILCA
jgi:hypothetical protein